MASSGRMSGEERRAQILGVARELFAEHGYKATTADVARAAGVSDALVVKHFGTKENLFRVTIIGPLIELFEAGLLEGRQRALDEDLGGPAEHLALLQEWARRWVALIREHRELLLSLVRGSADFADDAAQVFGLVQQLIDDVAAMLDEHAKVGGYRPHDSRTATYATLGALTMGALLAEDPDTFSDEVIDLLFFGVLDQDGRDALGR